MSLRFTAIRLSGGTTHQHIVRLWWTNPSSSETGDNSRAELVAWVEQGGKAYVEDRFGNRAAVGVATPQVGAKYLQTHVVRGSHGGSHRGFVAQLREGSTTLNFPANMTPPTTSDDRATA